MEVWCLFASVFVFRCDIEVNPFDVLASIHINHIQIPLDFIHLLKKITKYVMFLLWCKLRLKPVFNIRNASNDWLSDIDIFQHTQHGLITGFGLLFDVFITEIRYHFTYTHTLVRVMFRRHLKQTLSTLGVQWSYLWQNVIRSVYLQYIHYVDKSV